MRLVFGIVLLLGLGLAGFAVYMAQGYVGQYQAALAQERAARKAEVPMAELVVATEPLRYGQTLTPEHTALRPWPEASLPEGAFGNTAALFPDDAEPRQVIRAMEPGEPVLAVKVTAPGGEAGIAARLSAGKRAFAIKVDETSGVSGFLKPGDLVDVYWTGQAKGREITTLILPALRLVAIDQNADIDSTSPAVARTVTVEATPEQVARLAQAQSTGRMALALVGGGEVSIAGSVEVDQRRLLGIEAERQVAEAAPPSKPCTVRTRRGGQVTTTTIPCTN